MHVEVQVALNFLISFLFNKLPRRRVAQFGEELEATLKAKFAGHWYPEAPSKGSAYRCIRCAPPLERAVFEVAAYQAGISLMDIEQTLPHELTIWVDPGEVSYRLREGSPVKILYSTRGGGNSANGNGSVEGGSLVATTTLNPEAQAFRPTLDHQQHNQTAFQHQGHLSQHHPNHNFLPAATPAALPLSPQTPGFLPTAAKNGGTHPVTFTTAAFAATKFGSTKLKTNGNGGGGNGNGKRNGNGSNGNNTHRSSPTDFGLFGVNGNKHQQPRNNVLGGIQKDPLMNGGHNGWPTMTNGFMSNQNNRQQHPRNGGSTSPNQNPNFFANSAPNHQQTNTLDLIDCFADLEGCWKVGLNSNRNNPNNGNNNNSFIYQQNSQQSLDQANIWSSNGGNGMMSAKMSPNRKMESSFGNGNTFDNLLFGDPFDLNKQQSLLFNGHSELDLLDNTQLALLSERLWDEIFSISPEEENNGVSKNTAEGNHSANIDSSNGTEGGQLFCSDSASSSFSLSSMSSPSLSTTSNESTSNCSHPLNVHQLVNEFDSLSLNSNNSSTSSVGSNYIT